MSSEKEWLNQFTKDELIETVLMMRKNITRMENILKKYYFHEDEVIE